MADAVLYEGYLLYPYRASSSKNRARWQFGVLGPPGAAEAGIGEDSVMSVDCLVRPGADPSVAIQLRCLQLQTRSVEILAADGFLPVDAIVVGGTRWLTWDEATEAEQTLGSLRVAGLFEPTHVDIRVPAAESIEELHDGAGSLAGRLVRERSALAATMEVRATRVDHLVRLSLRLDNTAAAQSSRGDGAGQVVHRHPPAPAGRRRGVRVHRRPTGGRDRGRGQAVSSRRWWPVLAGPIDETAGVAGLSPIIVEEHAQDSPPRAAAPCSTSTEIDEILTLRVMTMTDAEKAEARATDPRAAEIIDRCDAMTPQDLQQLHGALRDPHDPSVFDTDVPWWDPAADASVAPETDAVMISGVRVSKGSLVTVSPRRRADAQDMFFTDMVAKVAAVLSDVDGGHPRRRHVGRRPCGRSARLVWPLPLLRPGRARPGRHGSGPGRGSTPR